MLVPMSMPDGYTLLMASAGILTANRFLYATMAFDPEKDFVTVSNVADMPMMAVVHPNVQANTLRELVGLARANPGKLNFGSPGIGTIGHLGLALFIHAAKINPIHVPCRGAAPAMTDLLAGQSDGVVDNPPAVLQQIEGGRLRPLVVAAKQRMVLLYKAIAGAVSRPAAR
jgi:tripartite-type tricarboxylate transporter receptor subunit TctC